MSTHISSQTPVPASSGSIMATSSDATPSLETEHSSPKSRVLSAITNSLQNALKINHDAASRTTKKLREMQASLLPGQGALVRATDVVQTSDRPGKDYLVLTNNRIHIFKKKLGEGTYSRVYQATAVPTSRHKLKHSIVSPSKPFTVALKVGKDPSFTFSPEKRRVEEATQGRVEGIDISLDTFKDANGIGYSVNECFDADASHHPFHLSQKPAKSILEFLIPVTNALANMHSTNFVHRDIKGPNLLVLDQNKIAETTPDQVPNLATTHNSDGQLVGALTDFGFLAKEKDRLHKTTTTLNYLDPTMFGTIEENLINQRKRRGIQTSKGDVFALGRTLDMDILRPLIKKISGRLPNHQNILNELKSIGDTFTIANPESFTDDFLRQMGELSNFRVIYVESHKGVKERLVHLADLEKIRIVLKPILMGLSKILGETEANALVELCELSCQMQEVEVRPTSQEVLVKLTEIMNTLNSPEAPDGSYEQYSATSETSYIFESTQSSPDSGTAAENQSDQGDATSPDLNAPIKKRRLSGAKSAEQGSNLDVDLMNQDAFSRNRSPIVASGVASSSPTSSNLSEAQAIKDAVKENRAKNKDIASSIDSQKKLKRTLVQDLDEETL